MVIHPTDTSVLDLVLKVGLVVYAVWSMPNLIIIPLLYIVLFVLIVPNM